MATRMQQRRGTAAQWTAANPILAAGEIGFETDTSKFKMGNGSSAWTALTYFANAAELSAIIDGAPAALNTLNELAEAMGDNPAFLTQIGTNLTNHQNDTTDIHGIADTSELATLSDITDAIDGVTGDYSLLAGPGLAWDADLEKLKTHESIATTSYVDTKVVDHSNDTTNVHGIADTTVLVTNSSLSSAVSAHSDDTTNVHGIADFAALATKAYADSAADGASGLASGYVTSHNADTTDVHGIADTSLLATKEYSDNALSLHQADTTNIHGILDTAELATKSYTDTAVTTHSSDTTDVHGIANTANLATKSYTDTAVSTHSAVTTNVHGIADTSLLALKSEVAAVTKTTLGLGNVDNTADTAKPVSTAQSQAIATAKSEAIASATAQVEALLAGAPAALNTLDELAAALGDDANFASTVTTSLGLKVDSLTPISKKTASYTLSSLTERDDLIEMGSASALTLTIPTDATLDYPIGTSIDILQTGAGQVTIAPVSGTVTVNATPGLKLRTTWSSCTLFKRAANTWVVYGDLTA